MVSLIVISVVPLSSIQKNPQWFQWKLLCKVTCFHKITIKVQTIVTLPSYKVAVSYKNVEV